MSSSIFRGIKNASYLAMGNLISQLISFIGFIYIARLLGPDDYGIYVSVGAFVGMFDIFLLNGLHKTVIRESTKDIPSMQIVLEKTIGVRNFLILLAIIVCITASFFTPYELQTKFYIVLFSFQLVHTGLNGFLSTIYQTVEKMQYIAVINIINRIIFVSATIIFLYMGFGLLALFLIALISNFLTILLNYIKTGQFIKFNFFSKIQFNKKTLKSALTFSILGFVIFLSTRVDLVMISLLGTAKDVGIYGVAYKIAHQAIMLRNVTAMAFFPILIKYFHKKSIKTQQLLKYSLYFFIVIFLLSIAATFFIEDIITFFLGEQYKVSGKILKTLIFYIAFAWSVLPFTTAAQATHNEKYLLLTWSITAGLNIPLNYIFFLQFSLIGIAYSTITINIVSFFLITVITVRQMKKQDYLN